MLYHQPHPDSNIGIVTGPRIRNTWNWSFSLPLPLLCPPWDFPFRRLEVKFPPGASHPPPSLESTVIWIIFHPGALGVKVRTEANTHPQKENNPKCDPDTPGSIDQFLKIRGSEQRVKWHHKDQRQIHTGRRDAGQMTRFLLQEPRAKEVQANGRVGCTGEKDFRDVSTTLGERIFSFSLLSQAHEVCKKQWDTWGKADTGSRMKSRVYINVLKMGC